MTTILTTKQHRGGGGENDVRGDQIWGWPNVGWVTCVLLLLLPAAALKLALELYLPVALGYCNGRQEGKQGKVGSVGTITKTLFRAIGGL